MDLLTGRIELAVVGGQFVSGPTTLEELPAFLREDAGRWAPIVRGIERRPA